MVANDIESESVVLQLLGIDKKWVRSSKGEWVDAKTLKQPAKIVEEQMEDALPVKKKWWKIW